MKKLLPALALMATTAALTTLFLAGGATGGSRSSGSNASEIEGRLEDLQRSIEELQEDLDSLALRVIALGEETAVMPMRTVSLSEREAPLAIVPASGSPSAGSITLESYQTIATVIRETEQAQAESDRRKLLDAQVAFVQEKVEELGSKIPLDPNQKAQIAEILSSRLRRRSEIRGTRPWWDYAPTEWSAMRDRMKEIDKEKNESIARLLTPKQLKKYKSWEKKRPTWFSPGSRSNPRGDDP